MRLGLGVQLSTELDLGAGRALSPQLSLEWLHEREDGARTMHGRFLEDQGRVGFTLQSDERDSQYFNLGLGASMALGKGKFAYFNYQTLLGMEQMSSHSIMGGFRMEF